MNYLTFDTTNHIQSWCQPSWYLRWTVHGVSPQDLSRKVGLTSTAFPSGEGSQKSVSEASEMDLHSWSLLAAVGGLLE